MRFEDHPTLLSQVQSAMKNFLLMQRGENPRILMGHMGFQCLRMHEVVSAAFDCHCCWAARGPAKGGFADIIQNGIWLIGPHARLRGSGRMAAEHSGSEDDDLPAAGPVREKLPAARVSNLQGTAGIGVPTLFLGRSERQRHPPGMRPVVLRPAAPPAPPAAKPAPKPPAARPAAPSAKPAPKPRPPAAKPAAKKAPTRT